jgi:hypothetical protein
MAHIPTFSYSYGNRQQQYFKYALNTVSIVMTFLMASTSNSLSRQVTDSDIQLAEKKLMQTLEMIASKKKQIVVHEARVRTQDVSRLEPKSCVF